MIQVQFRIQIEDDGIFSVQIDLLQREDTTNDEIKLARAMQEFNEKVLKRVATDSGYTIKSAKV